MEGDDHNDDLDDDLAAPPSTSRLARGGTRRYRVLRRASDRERFRDRFSRQRHQRPLGELIGDLISHHGLSDEVRQRVVCLYWLEIAGERIAAKTWPVSFADGVLRLSVINSSWVHEMQFLKAGLAAQINAWVHANRRWLGPAPLVTEIRLGLEMRERTAIVDRDHANRLRLRQLRRARRARQIAPPTATDAELDAIRAETSTIADAELRALIESVRIKWNR